MKKLLTIVCLISLFLALALLTGCNCNCGKNNSESSSDTGSQSQSPIDNGYHGYDEYLSGNKSDIYFINTADNTIERDFTDTQKTVTYGTHVKLVTPLVIDGAGSVLKVGTEVYTKAGNKTECVSGGFFALSKSGYTIKFIIERFTGEAPIEKIQSVEVIGADGIYKNDGLTVDYTAAFSILPVRLTEIGGNAVDLTSLMSSDQLAVYNATRAQGETVKWKVVSVLGETEVLSGETLDLSVKGLGAYAVAAFVDGDEYDRTLFLDCVDFINFNQPPEWNAIGDEIDSSVNFSASDNSKIEVVKDVTEGDGIKAYKAQSGLTQGKTEQYSFKLSPRHSKAYYELFATDGYSLAFDVYGVGGIPLDKSSYLPVIAETTDGGVIYDKINMLGVKVCVYNSATETWMVARGQHKTEEWITYVLPLTEYGKSWDSLITMEDVAYTQNAWCYAQTSTVYFANFRLVKAQTAVEKDPLVDINGKSTLMLSSYISEEANEKVSAAAAVEYTLKAGDETVVITDKKGVLATVRIGTRIYQFTVKADDITVYSTNIDFYNSTKFEFAPAIEGGYYKVESGSAATEYTPSLVHGEKYYQKFGDYFVSVGVRVETSADYAIFTVAGKRYSGRAYSNGEFRVSFSVKEFIANYGSFKLFAYYGDSVTSGVKDAPYAKKVTAYLGNFAAAQIPAFTAQTGKEVSVLQSDGEISVYDLIKNSSVKAFVTKYSAFAEIALVTENNEFAPILNGSVNAANLGAGRYKLVIKICGETAYECTVTVTETNSGGTVGDIPWQPDPWA